MQYFNDDVFVSSVWKSKYAAPGEETPEQTHKRLATEFAKVRFSKDSSVSVEDLEKEFYSLFEHYKKIIPAGRVQAGLGVDESYRSLSNCLRLPPPEDSYSSIMLTDTMLVSAAKRGNGYGVGLSKLRPAGAVTTNASRTSTGVVLFGNRYSNSTHEVGQEGRRGACLLDLDIKHPDSPRFATAKLDKTSLTGANISFKMFDDFIAAVKNEEDYVLRFPVDADITSIDTSTLKYGELTQIGNIYLRKIKAAELWKESIHSVWADGCPGLQFWENVIGYDPASVYEDYQIDGTNACGEQPMAVYDTCRLIALNLFSVVVNPFKSDARIDYDLLYELCYKQLELGDDLVDLELQYIQRIIDKIKSDPESELTKATELSLWQNVYDITKKGRRIGCGITGMADMLAAIGVKYDSEEALEVVGKIMHTKMKAELNASIDLAIKYGPFDGWAFNKEFTLSVEIDDYGTVHDFVPQGKNRFYQFLADEFPEEVNRMKRYGRRNVNWNTIAPTGTISIIAKAIDNPNMSSGCEPQFGLFHFRNKKCENPTDPYDFIDEVGIRWKQYPVMAGAFKDYILTVIDNPKDINTFTKTELEEFAKKSPWNGCLADDIDWKKRIEIQAVLQKYTTSAISSTINLPNTVKESVISEIYMYAHEKGLKGITCYRDGSKGGVLVKEAKTDSEFKQHQALKRPKSVDCDIYHVKVRGENFTVIVGHINKSPYEVFARSGVIAEGFKQGKLIKRSKSYKEHTLTNFLDILEK